MEFSKMLDGPEVEEGIAQDAAENKDAPPMLSRLC